MSTLKEGCAEPALPVRPEQPGEVDEHCQGLLDLWAVGDAELAGLGLVVPENVQSLGKSVRHDERTW